MKKISILILIFIVQNLMAQQKMKPLSELINTTDSGWPIVEDWAKSAKNKVEILKLDSTSDEEALYNTQVTTRSPMGAIIYNSGGIIIDNGWIRILGSGNSKLNRSISMWNKGKSFVEYGNPATFLLIADDAIGGFYILNGGALGNDLGKIYYFAPDSLEYEPLDLTYSEFVLFCFNNDLNDFYKGLRWKNWKTDVKNLSYDKVYNFVPFLWTKEGKEIEKNSRKEVPIEEQYLLNIDLIKQLNQTNSR
ncbi:DUF2625 domain-containing protein [Flavobacterium amniphilum]|uniref:DUF2625 domain-containing protein n=1 Tax=Flavobacterium amniphilum TaxID=1834035 RepID=UPI002029ED8E|nr:DUF2625 domain-containing protein [Flavobacterium amniphilum]MCL9806827.1 DUF2625 domain-containing protein [Flavobacterium amniphilum]